jgi:hypothetical protein
MARTRSRPRLVARVSNLGTAAGRGQQGPEITDEKSMVRVVRRSRGSAAGPDHSRHLASCQYSTMSGATPFRRGLPGTDRFFGLVERAKLTEVSLTSTPSNPECIITSKKRVSPERQFYELMQRRAACPRPGRDSRSECMRPNRNRPPAGKCGPGSGACGTAPPRRGESPPAVPRNRAERRAGEGEGFISLRVAGVGVW